MAQYEETEAQQRFDELIARALDGEVVVITCNGVPVVELRPTVGFVDFADDTSDEL